MQAKTQKDQTGRFFTLFIPMKDRTQAPCYVAGCTILEHTPEKINVHVLVDDWLETTICIPTPYRHQTIEHQVYLALCAIIDKERIDFLCSMTV